MGGGGRGVRLLLAVFLVKDVDTGVICLFCEPVKCSSLLTVLL